MSIGSHFITEFEKIAKAPKFSKARIGGRSLLSSLLHGALGSGIGGLIGYHAGGAMPSPGYTDPGTPFPEQDLSNAFPDLSGSDMGHIKALYESAGLDQPETVSSQMHERMNRAGGTLLGGLTGGSLGSLYGRGSGGAASARNQLKKMMR